MSNGTSAASQLDAVDVLARDLYHRAKSAGPDFEAVTTAVRRLHSVLKHTRAEVDDAESTLNTAERSNLYQRKLIRIIEDSEFTLQSLESVLDKHTEGAPLDDGTRGKVGNIATQLADDKRAIDDFLDTVQLPSKPQKVVDTHDASLDGIKDKVDAIAARICGPRNHDGSGDYRDDESMWHQFQAELEKEGFSRDVLHKNKEVLRAYIRELDTNNNEHGAPPTVRGLLEAEERHSRPDLAVVPASSNHPEAWSPKEMMRPTFDNEKYIPSIKAERRQPEEMPYPPALPQQNTALSYERHSSDDDDDRHDPDAMALISTRDLMSMDGLNSQMGAMQLGVSPQPNYSISPTSSATLKYLPPGVSANLPPPGSELALSSSPSNFGTSPRFAPLPPYSQAQTSPPPPYNASARQPRRLAPDRYGMDIPPDAQWTRIKRSLVSPEVLERAGVRYEARPTFVAVLGILTRDEITHYARLSWEARARRSSHSQGNRPQPSTFERRYSPEYNRGKSSSRSPEQRNDYHPDNKDRKASQDSDSESVLWDESDTEDDYDEKKKRPYIVVPPPGKDGKNGTSPAATVQPKPILKNKNENHVRFDPEGPHEISQDELNKSPTHRDSHDRDRRNRDRNYDRDHDRRRRRREREKEYYDSRRDPRDRGERGDREYSSSSRRHRDHRDGSHYHDRDSRDPRDRKEKEKKKWAPTIGAMGIGGAAGSLLSVLTEAAQGI